MTPRRRAGVTSRWLADEEVALLTPDGKQLLLLNALGGIIWELCDGRSVDEIAELVCRRFEGIDQRRVVADVERLVRELEAAGCLETT